MVCMTLRWREMDSNFQFRAIYATASRLRPVRGRYGGQRAGACSQTPGAVNPGDLMRALELYAKCPCKV